MTDETRKLFNEIVRRKAILDQRHARMMFAVEICSDRALQDYSDILLKAMEETEIYVEIAESNLTEDQKFPR